MDLTLPSQLLLNPTTSDHSTTYSTESIAMTTLQVWKRILRSLKQRKREEKKKENCLINTAQGCPDEAEEAGNTVCNFLSRHSELGVMTLIINPDLEKTTIPDQGSFECLCAPDLAAFLSNIGTYLYHLIKRIRGEIHSHKGITWFTVRQNQTTELNKGKCSWFHINSIARF